MTEVVGVTLLLCNKVITLAIISQTIYTDTVAKEQVRNNTLEDIMLQKSNQW